MKGPAEEDRQVNNLRGREDERRENSILNSKETENNRQKGRPMLSNATEKLGRRSSSDLARRKSGAACGRDSHQNGGSASLAPSLAIKETP